MQRKYRCEASWKTFQYSGRNPEPDTWQAGMLLLRFMAPSKRLFIETRSESQSSQIVLELILLLQPLGSTVLHLQTDLKLRFLELEHCGEMTAHIRK